MPPRRYRLALLGLLIAPPAFAGPVLNPAFSSPLGSVWIAGAGDASAPTFTRDNTDARPLDPALPGDTTDGWSVRVSSRTHARDTLVQNIKTSLSNAGSGHTFTTRFHIKTDAHAAVRCVLRWSDSNIEQTPRILAERIVRPGEEASWLRCDGTATLTWQSLTSARIEWEVSQHHRGTATTWFPAYRLDDITMELDDDGDGLLNTEESADHTQSTTSFSDDADSDHDGMDDAWERTHLLAPHSPADATADPDADGFTNFQEYHAATDPRAASSYPGRPSDPKANAKTRALLRHLALIPSLGRTLVGQHIVMNISDYAKYWTPLTQPLAGHGGKTPAILSLAVEHDTNGPLAIAASIDHAIPHALSGGIVLVKWAPYNPWIKSNGTYARGTDNSKIDIPGLLDPSGTPTNGINTAAENLAARAAFLSWIDATATELKRYAAATGDAPLLFRPLSEMNGAWFWWGLRPREDYLGLWTLIRDRLTGDDPALGQHSLHQLLFVSEPASSEHLLDNPSFTNVACDYYYPGDDAVDVIGHNLYDNDWILPWDANRLFRRYPKIYAIPQAGPADPERITPTTFSNLTYRDTILGNPATNAPARYPRLSFFIPWSGWDSHLDDDNNPATNSNNDDANPAAVDPLTHFKMAIVDQANSAALMTDPRVDTLDELAWLPPANLHSTPTGSGSATLDWQAAPGAIAYQIETITDPATPPWQTVSLTASTSATISGLNPGSAGFFRIIPVFADGPGGPSEAAPFLTWTRIQDWKKTRLGAPDAPDDADPDADSLSNLLEYAFAREPLSADSSDALPQLAVGLDDHLTFTYFQAAERPDLVFTPEWTPDLTGTWQSSATYLAELSRIATAGGETVTVRAVTTLASAPVQFLRLRVTRP